MASILFHGAQRVLAVLFALILVEYGKYLARHFARRIIVGLLCNGDYFDACPLELAFVEREFKRVAEETRQAMHDDGFEWRGVLHRLTDHLLENWPLVISSRFSRLDVFLANAVAVCFAPITHLSQLIRYR
ncbi:MAG: hypothetical protein WC100_13540 [Sterolibacterium sp.]